MSSYLVCAQNRHRDAGTALVPTMHQTFGIWGQISLIRGDASLFQDSSIPVLFRKIPCFL
jgi:hypothetical protein